MKLLVKKVKARHLVYLLISGGLLLMALNFTGQFNPFAALNFNSQPLFSNLDQFVLVAQDKIELSYNVQVSSGDLASNEEIRINQNNIINGNLFSDNIRIGATSTINGNTSFNKLEIEPNSQIIGQTSTPILLPIIKLPAIPAFQAGGQDLIITQNQTIFPGNFDKIEVQENIALTLNPGTYNLNKLELKNNSKLLFSGETIINIQKELVIKEKVLIAQTTNIPSTGLQINVQEDKDIEIGKDSLISVKLLAPNSQINLKERITFRGQILAEEIKVGEETILSREEASFRIANPADIITDPDGGVYPINEILVSLTPKATFNDAQIVANSINGRIVGVVSSINLFQIEVITNTTQELEAIINNLRGRTDLRVDGIFRNFKIPMDF